jgi:hypothetical protein
MGAFMKTEGEQQQYKLKNGNNESAGLQVVSPMLRNIQRMVIANLDGKAEVSG